MSDRLHKGLRRLAEEQLARTPILTPRPRPWWRRALDWCQGIEPAPEPDYRRRAYREVKRQYRRWRARQAITPRT